jgi:streptomycin 6-kinase
LRFWASDPTVHLLAADETINALLLERCRPGTPLRDEPVTTQDSVIARLLQRLWRPVSPSHGFRHLSMMIEYWSTETRGEQDAWPDRALVEEGLDVFARLSRPLPGDVLLATDVHAGNVLRSTREPWLVIDPKPFVGDPAYDATQHMFNNVQRVLASPSSTLLQWADQAGVDCGRMRLWMFARAAAEPRTRWSADLLRLARLLAP